MSKIILKNIGEPAAPSDGQVILYAQDGGLRTWTHGGSPSSLSTFSANFSGFVYAAIRFGEGDPPSKYYFANKELAAVYPLSAGVVITSVAIYIEPRSSWNVPLSVRAYRGVSGEEPVDAGELIVLEPKSEEGGDGGVAVPVGSSEGISVPAVGGSEIGTGIDITQKFFSGDVSIANGLSVSLDGDAYMTIAFQPVTEDLGGVFIRALMTIVVTMSQA